jgi:hypothetical protein
MDLSQHIVRHSESGQAAMEFVLSMLLLLTFFFFIVRLCAVFAIGNYIHYATFMGARAYFASAENIGAQMTRAESVMEASIGQRWKRFIKRREDEGNSEIPGVGIGGGYFFTNESQARNSWNQGVSFSFRSRLELYPWSRAGTSANLDLASESWLGREETAAECEATRTKIATSLPGDLKNMNVEWDNGC